ncbi:Gamma-aminobutyrate:alpha-ketoglutarate aminotransferase [Labilithrix luteola]|uniref:alanine--glyoxylate transaminase n=1 Tax=Labilithrix luteola TaxID=1391654 RepID=A0A0K1Q966_9BACT|nr:aspartate aminotransferase family protein [Labilithrix luteola]AKV02273.1 Gamma-aminobutyrate:alpha-ketoglutarate aminotransferase [Labilithrix luteola]
MSDGKRTSADIRAKHKEFLFPSVGTFYEEPVCLDSGHGARLEDLDGRKYLDFFGGILTVSVGQTHPKVNAALHAQIDRLGHVSTLYPTVGIVELAEKLIHLAPGRIGKAGKAFFTASGTEADETAVALAQLATGRQELIALRHGYSGRSMLAQSLTAHSKYRAVTSQVPGIKHAHAPYCYRCPFGATVQHCDFKCAKDIEELIQTTTTGQVAGFLAEPIQGVGGFIVAPDGYFKVAVDIVRNYGGLFICDEVQTGFGRTGSKMWGIEHHEGVEPDIMTMAKGIANGLPIGACLATVPVADSWKGGNISTFGGNPISTAAANATIDVIVEEKLTENAAIMGKYLREGLEALKRKYPKTIGDVRGKGLMQAIELVKDETQKDRTPDAASTSRLFEETKKRGLLIGRGGLWNNVVRIAPPLNVTQAEIEEALKSLDESFAAFAEVAR